MNAEEIRTYCLAKKGVEESFPFGGDVLVFKILDKIFALMSLESRPLRINLKMDEKLVPVYREKYNGVLEGYHMNKKHWNTILTEESDVSARMLSWMIDHSYEMVLSKLPKSAREELNNSL
jgi:predicted DNA-binding protein (MmcQ/YjbR family)